MKQFEEYLDDPYFEKIGEEHMLETDDEFIFQAGNGHIQVFDKAEGRIVMHITCTKMYSDEELQNVVCQMKEVAARAAV